MGSGYDLKIPDWKPLDFSAFGDLPQIYQAARSAKLKDDMERQNAETQKRYADNQDRKINHEITRQTWEDQRLVEKGKEDKAKERASMFTPGSPVFAAARQSPEMGNAAGAPYGISFESQADKPPSIAPESGKLIQGMLPSRLASDALAAPTNPTEQGIKDGDLYGPPQPEQAPVDTSEPNPDVQALGDKLADQPPAMKHLYTKYEGQRFEVPGTKSNYFAEPKYNDMVQQMMDSGMSEKDAIARADHTRQVDIGQGGLAARAAANLAQKQGTQLTREEQIAANQARLTTSRQNSQGRDAAIVEAAGRRSPTFITGGGGGGPQVPLDPKLVNTWLSVHKEGKASGLAKQAVQAKDLFERANNELDANRPPNAELQQTAIHTLAAISTSMAGSGRLSVQAMNDVREAQGAVTNLINEGNRLVQAGVSPEEYIKPFREAFARLGEVAKLQRLSLYDAVDHQSGRKSVFAQHPGLSGVIDGSMYGFANDMGLSPEDIASLGEPAAQGGAPPAAPPAPAQRRPRAHAAPQGHAAGPAPMDDASAVKMAQARYARDPNDAVAKKVLQMHGLLK